MLPSVAVLVPETMAVPVVMLARLLDTAKALAMPTRAWVVLGEPKLSALAPPKYCVSA
jgi:hypothetical protein